MDFATLITTFGLVFLAELGDKTQLATMALAADSESPVATFFGSSLGLILSSLLAVAAGDVVGQWLPTEAIELGAGVAFVAIGLFLIFRS